MRPDRHGCSTARYLAIQGVAGCSFGSLSGLLVLVTNTLGIWSLILASAEPAATATIFLIGSALIFGPLVIATAVGVIAGED